MSIFAVSHAYIIPYIHKYNNMEWKSIMINVQAWIILGMGSANERRRYYVTPPLIGRAHTQNDLCTDMDNKVWQIQ